MSTSAVDQPWLLLPIRTISPLRMYQTTPDPSRSRVTRRETSSTVPVASPVSMTSPTPYWSSRIMKIPDRKSLTRLCAPNPRATPPTPAAASTGARLIPTMSSTVRMATNATMKVTTLRSSEPIVRVRWRCRSWAAPVAWASTRLAREVSPVRRASDFAIVAVTTRPIERSNNHRITIAAITVITTLSGAPTNQSQTPLGVTFSSAFRNATASGIGIPLLGPQGAGDRVTVLDDQATQGGRRVRVGGQPRLGGLVQARIGQRHRIEAPDEDLDDRVGRLALHGVEHRVVLLDVRLEQPRVVDVPEAGGEGLEHRVRQAVLLDPRRHAVALASAVG